MSELTVDVKQARKKAKVNKFVQIEGEEMERGRKMSEPNFYPAEMRSARWTIPEGRRAPEGRIRTQTRLLAGARCEQAEISYWRKMKNGKS